MSPEKIMNQLKHELHILGGEKKMFGGIAICSHIDSIVKHLRTIDSITGNIVLSNALKHEKSQLLSELNGLENEINMIESSLSNISQLSIQLSKNR